MKGSIRRRGNGWWAVIDLPRGEDGRRSQRGKTFRTKREAEEWLARAAVEASQGCADLGRLTVAQFLDQWLAAVGPHLKPNTRASYAVAVKRWKAVIGPQPLRKLTPLAV